MGENDARLYKTCLSKDNALLKQTLYQRFMIDSRLYEQLASSAFHVSLQNSIFYAIQTKNTACSYKKRAKSAPQKISRICTRPGHRPIPPYTPRANNSKGDPKLSILLHNPRPPNPTASFSLLLQRTELRPDML